MAIVAGPRGENEAFDIFRFADAIGRPPSRAILKVYTRCHLIRISVLALNTHIPDQKLHLSNRKQFQKENPIF